MIVSIVADIGAVFQDDQDGVAGPAWWEDRLSKAKAEPVAFALMSPEEGP